MKKPASQHEPNQGQEPAAISEITVGGFKSIRDDQTIEIRPLTILAGANSSGKSTIMQPLLLMKQTLEADVDPGVFRLDGPNVSFAQYEDFLSQSGTHEQSDRLVVRLSPFSNAQVSSIYEIVEGGGDLQVIETFLSAPPLNVPLKLGMTAQEVVEVLRLRIKCRTS